MNDILCLFKKLDQHSIEYCHWKSNHNLDKMLRGDDDVDILVSKSDYKKFLGLINFQGFYEASQNVLKNQPGIRHFYKYDRKLKKIIHIHSYSSIVTGMSLVKNHCLPLERIFLSERMIMKGVWVPSAECELILLVLRNSIKYGSLIDIYFCERNSRLDLRREYDRVTEFANRDKVKSILESYLPQISYDDFCLAERQLFKGGSVLRRVVKLYRMRQTLNLYKRMSSRLELLNNWVKILEILIGRFSKKKDMYLKNRGLLLTFTGPPATGKSTLSTALLDVYKNDIAISYHHLGRPAPSFLTLPLHWALPYIRKLIPSLRSTRVEKTLVENSTKKHRTYPLIFIARRVMLAYERKLMVQKLFKLASAGEIVICDRFPSSLPGSIDGATFFPAEVSAEKSRLKRFLMKQELAIYKGCPNPDLVIELTVPLHVAIDRNENRNKTLPQNNEFVKFRHDTQFGYVALSPTTAVIQLDTSIMDIEQCLQHIIDEVEGKL